LTKKIVKYQSQKCKVIIFSFLNAQGTNDLWFFIGFEQIKKGG